MKYDYPEHTSDTFIRGFGKTLEEAFENTALGLVKYIAKDATANTERQIVAESEDEKSLLFDFLNQFLILLDSENLVFSSVKVKSIEKTKKGLKINATAFGELFDPEKHTQTTHVKAITYHDMTIAIEKDKYIVKVLVDI